MFRFLTWIAIFSVAGVVAAAAATVGPEKATELLARAHAINVKCKVLASGDGQSLSNLLAQAEIALATKKSVKAARSALERGRVTGQAASCDGVSAKAVTDVLGAARSASAVSDIEDTVDVEVATERPANEEKPVVTKIEPEKVKVAATSPAAPATEAMAIVRDVPEKISVVAHKVQVTPAPKVRLAKQQVPRRNAVRLSLRKSKPAVRVARAPAAKSVVLTRQVQKVQKTRVVKSNGNGYSVLAENYYKELRCRNLTRGSVNAMYARVLREHRAAVSSQGAGAVRALLRNAQSRAAGRSC